jgi:DNA invertase Pin-like site-specific DNA recombinase
MITIANPEKYVAGLYERLSNENIEVGNGEVIVSNEDERESGSISTQKLFLKNFCKENNIQVYDDYTDDGFSGATFDRPNFNRMIKDIENKKINLIIVKDLSRFGRLSSKISYYLEEFFIEKGVRFIAVTDDIDTGHIETSEEMVQFKAFFNEWFLRDTSRKVRNGKKTRAKEGKVMTTYPTYGYKKDPLDNNHYVIDQDIAPIVRRIFMLARNGKTPAEIGKILTDERTLVPSEIVGNGHTRKDGIKRGWNRNTVKRILQNVTYLGWVSNGNTKKINYKSKKTMIMPKEDRIIVQGMHTPIIDEETFNIVQDMIKSRTSTRVKSYDWLLKGLVCCKECGKKLSLVPQKHPNKTTFYLRCNTYASNTQLGLCTPHSNNLEKVTNFVIEQIKKRCREFLDEEKYTKIANTSKDKIIKDRFNVKNEILILEKKVKDINKKIDKLFEDKYKGLFEDEDFTRIYSMQIQSRKDAEERMKQLKELEEKEDSSVDINKLVKDFVNMEEITRTMLVSLVDKIEISENKEITIYYKFNILNMRKEENENLENVG